MTDLTHIDCQGLAGAWTLGTAQAGFTLVHRASLGKFGDQIIAANRHLVPGPWEQDPGNGADEWEPMQAAYLTGTPPCSGFSLLNKSKGKNSRGADSNINSCMKELAKYAARCRGRDGKLGPEVVAFESVQGAFKQGRDLMRALRAIIEEGTGSKYTLNHVLMSGATIGASQMRHRYYFVVARVPFGIDQPEPRRVATYADAFGDLADAPTDSWEERWIEHDDDRDWWLLEQGITNEVFTYADAGALRRLVGDHVTVDGWKIRVMTRDLEPYWTPGKAMPDAMRAYRADRGEFPEGTAHWWDDERDEMRGFTHPTRIRPNRPGYVCTGGCTGDFIHYRAPRMLSVREVARLMGYPDAWRWTEAKTPAKAGMFIGKCCPVQSGRWISTWVRRALEGNPGAPLEAIDGDREFKHNSTLLYKGWLARQEEPAGVVA